MKFAIYVSATVFLLGLASASARAADLDRDCKDGVCRPRMQIRVAPAEVVQTAEPQLALAYRFPRLHRVRVWINQHRPHFVELRRCH